MNLSLIFDLLKQLPAIIGVITELKDIADVILKPDNDDGTYSTSQIIKLRAFRVQTWDEFEAHAEDARKALESG